MKKANLILIIVAACIAVTAAVCIPKKANKPQSENLNLVEIKDKTESPDFYAYAESLNLVEICNANDLTLEKLQSRNGKLIIERVIGIVEDAENGVGHVLFSPNYEYISYERVKGIHNGNIICTYLIYNPDTNCEDDVLMRFDYIIDSVAVE